MTESTAKTSDAFDRALADARAARDEERRARDAAATSTAAISGNAVGTAPIAGEEIDAAPEVEVPPASDAAQPETTKADAPKVDDVGVGEHKGPQESTQPAGEASAAPADDALTTEAPASPPAVTAPQIGTAVARPAATERTPSAHPTANAKPQRSERAPLATAAMDAATSATAPATLADRVAPATADSDRAVTAPALADATPKSAAPAPSPAPAATNPAAGTPVATATPAAAADAAPAARAVAPPRFVDARTVQMVEANRASLFQQIAVRLSPGGGEMRLRLDPPELGHLDVRMVMDERGDMRLHVMAERADVTAVLQQHVNELRHVLAQSGVNVSETNISTGHRGSANGGFEGQGSGARGRDATDAQREDDAAPSLARGFITGGGLDFLV